MKPNLNNKTKTILALAMVAILLGAWSCEAEEAKTVQQPEEKLQQHNNQRNSPLDLIPDRSDRVTDKTKQLISDEEFQKIQKDVNQKVSSLSGKGQIESAQELVEFLKFHPGFINAGMSEDGSSVWGTIRDGTTLMIPNARHESKK